MESAARQVGSNEPDAKLRVSLTRLYVCMGARHQTQNVLALARPHLSLEALLPTTAFDSRVPTLVHYAGGQGTAPHVCFIPCAADSLLTSVQATPRNVG